MSAVILPLQGKLKWTDILKNTCLLSPFFSRFIVLSIMLFGKTFTAETFCKFQIPLNYYVQIFWDLLIKEWIRSCFALTGTRLWKFTYFPFHVVFRCTDIWTEPSIRRSRNAPKIVALLHASFFSINQIFRWSVLNAFDIESITEIWIFNVNPMEHRLTDKRIQLIVFKSCYKNIRIMAQGIIALLLHLLNDRFPRRIWNERCACS